MNSFKSYRVIYISFFIGLILSIIPLPVFLNQFRPNFIFLLIFYWVLAFPHRVSIGHSFIFGIILDLLLGSMLGMHAMVFSILGCILSLNYQRFRCISLVQTTILIGFLILLSKISLYEIGSSMREIVLHIQYFFSIFTSMLIWPWFLFLMQKITIKFKVD